jgi:glycosyltransferase involved in cell wall biosynthesis
MNEVRISVALITRNGPERLRRCLQSLREQNCQPFEVVISDDSAPGSEYAILNQSVADDFGCRYVSGPRRGLYANRNYAALACNGTHIRTMDDDHTFPLGHWGICEAAVRSDPLAFWSTGEDVYVEEERVISSTTALQLDPSGFSKQPVNLDRNWAVADGSTTYPSDVFRLGYRMIEQFSYGSAYLEFGAYIFHCGYIGRCVRGAYINHHATRETLSRIHAKSPDITKSRLFAILACNLYLQPNISLALKYAIACWRDSGMGLSFLSVLTSMQGEVRRRWVIDFVEKHRNMLNETA